MAITLVISAVDNSCWDVFISLIKQQILGVVAFSQSTYIGYLNEKTTAFRSLFQLLSFCINACHADVIACRLIRVQALTSLMDFSWIIAISWRLKPSPLPNPEACDRSPQQTTRDPEIVNKSTRLSLLRAHACEPYVLPVGPTSATWGWFVQCVGSTLTLYN